MSDAGAGIAPTLVDIARAAGAVLAARFSTDLEVDEKGRADLVTDADRASEALIEARLVAAFPGASLLLEEGGDRVAPGTGHEGLRFLVDPLDGTTNYAAGLPHYAVCLGAVDAEGVRAGVVYNPGSGELFWAERGTGAFLATPDGAERPLHVSGAARLRDSVVATGFAYDRFENPDDNHAEFCALNLLTRGCRRFGVAGLDLAFVAAGRFAGFWERGLKPWDLAAGICLVEVAGGRVSNYGAAPCSLSRGEVVATNGHVHDELIASVGRARRAAGLSMPP